MPADWAKLGSGWFLWWNGRQVTSVFAAEGSATPGAGTPLGVTQACHCARLTDSAPFLFNEKVGLPGVLHAHLRPHTAEPVGAALGVQLTPAGEARRKLQLDASRIRRAGRYRTRLTTLRVREADTSGPSHPMRRSMSIVGAWTSQTNPRPPIARTPRSYPRRSVTSFCPTLAPLRSSGLPL